MKEGITAEEAPSPKRRSSLSWWTALALLLAGATLLVSCDPAVAVPIENACGESVQIMLWGERKPPSDETIDALIFATIAEGATETEVVGTEWPGGWIFVRSTEEGPAKSFQAEPGETVVIPASACP